MTNYVVSSGTLAFHRIVSDGDVLTVLGTAFATIMSRGGYQAVSRGGSALGAIVSSNGSETLYRGGTVIGTVVSYGGNEVVFDGGLAIGTILSSDTETVAMVARPAGPSSALAATTSSLTVAQPTRPRSPVAARCRSAAGASRPAVSSSPATAILSRYTTPSGPPPRSAASRSRTASTLSRSAMIRRLRSCSSSDRSADNQQGWQQLRPAILWRYKGSDFVLGLDGGSGTNLELYHEALPCFVLGMHIMTAAGERPVEALRVGDHVRTDSGALLPIVRIGSHEVNCLRHAHPEKVRPVRIGAHAFGANQPRRHFYLSPDHAVFFGHVLIPVKHLINGRTICQIERPEVTYVHVELSHHDVVMAEGLPTERYLNTGDRCAFKTGGMITMLHPVFGDSRQDGVLVSEALGYAPLQVTGPIVDRLRGNLERLSAAAQDAAMTRRAS